MIRPMKFALQMRIQEGGLPPASAERLAETFLGAASGYSNAAEMLSNLIKHLMTPCGKMLERTILEEVLSGRVPPAQVFLLPLDKMGEDPGPRKTIQAMFCRALQAHNKALPAGARVPENRLFDIVRELERSIYNNIIHNCEERSSSIVRSWQNETFVSDYSARSNTIFSHLDPKGSMVQMYGNKVALRLLLGELSPTKAGEMQAIDLCPEAFEHERDVIQARSQEEIEERTSTLWKCPNCKARSSRVSEVQDRAADEPATIWCICTECSTRWKPG
jgi:DNA-directed RNA polymerase subunit M/transcription elongation factor TFIIS